MTRGAPRIDTGGVWAPGVGLPDYHTHNSRCGHASGTLREYVEAALRRGLSGMGASAHLPLVHTRDPILSMALSELHDYVGEVRALQAEYPGFILLGIEADYRPDTFDDVRGLLESYPFDYVIGSVHYLDGWPFDDPRQRHTWDGREIEDVYRRYFDLVGEAAETGAFTLIGHLDLVKKWGHRPPRPLEDAARALAERIARAEVVVEVNTAGLRKPVAELYPDVTLLRLLREQGVAVTFGSDAHSPQDVGRDFDAALAAVREAGFDSYAALEYPPTGIESPDHHPAGNVGRTPRAIPTLRPLPDPPSEMTEAEASP
ncbi:MAG: histidinol-phosphatase HisJ family protein [Actinobacteria bacterium]|nr:histidinol-phosphatase HisJ family protein [Actinomycetota bacterium]